MKAEKIAELLSQSELMESLSHLFQSEQIEDLAYKTRFITRKTSRLTGKMFLTLNMCDFGEQKADMSLNEKCHFLSDHYAIELSKQSLDERYNTYAVQFMRACFTRLFRDFTKSFIAIKGIESCFSGIYLTDASSFQLPSSLSAFYAGNGGDNSGSSVKIQLHYELLKGQMVDLSITDGKQADVSYLSRVETCLSANSLQIADLGYFCLSHLEKIASKKAYFLSRYKTGTLLYVKDKQGGWQELNLFTLLSSAKNSWDLAEVWIGKKERLPVRLVIERLPEEVKARRLKKLKAQYAGVSKQRAKYESSELKHLLCGFNLFITNAEASKLSREQVSSFYTLRWQIELFFKIWKSILSIDKIAQMSIFRFECLLYGRLIALLVSTQIQAFLRDTFAHDPDIGIELSEWKAIAEIKKNY